MEFLVSIQVNVPVGMTDDERSELLAREATRGRELKDSGVIKRIWRVPGRHANVGIWEAADATELHDFLMSLPLFKYMNADVSALATHYLEAS